MHSYIGYSYPCIATHAYGTLIRVRGIILAYTRTECPVRVWDVPYAYGAIYGYGAEHWQVTPQEESAASLTTENH